MFGLGPTELIVIVVIVLVFFGGAKKLPEMAKSLGSGIVEFKRAVQGEEQKAAQPPPTQPTASATASSDPIHPSASAGGPGSTPTGGGTSS